jgi:hypothetical protein
VGVNPQKILFFSFYQNNRSNCKAKLKKTQMSSKEKTQTTQKTAKKKRGEKKEIDIPALLLKLDKFGRASLDNKKNILFTDAELGKLHKLFDDEKLSREQVDAFQNIVGDAIRGTSDDESDNDTSGRRRNGPNLKGFVEEKVEFWSKKDEEKPAIIQGKRTRKPVKRFGKWTTHAELNNIIGEESESEEEESDNIGSPKAENESDSEEGGSESDGEYQPTKEELEAAKKELEEDIESDTPSNEEEEEVEEEDDDDDDDDDDEDESEDNESEEEEAKPKSKAKQKPKKK